MRWIWLIALIAISGVAIADDTATRVAVIEKDVKLLREDVRALRRSSITKAEWKMLCENVDEIKTLVNPKLEKVDILTTWREGHVKIHDMAEKGKDRSIVFWFGLLTIVFAAVTFGKDFIVARRNGNHD